jgi:hypothetical protein
MSESRLMGATMLFESKFLAAMLTTAALVAPSAA